MSRPTLQPAGRRRRPNSSRVGMVVVVLLLLALLVILAISPSWLYLRNYQRTPGTPAAPTQTSR